MKSLIKGVHHFQQNVFSSHQTLFQRLAQGQEPQALFITCSDSRINPNLITHTEPGELFILRNAGNIVPPYGVSQGGEAPTIEFAVAGLGVKHVIVCGHTLCGAVNGLFDPTKLAKMPIVAEWLRFAETTRRVVTEYYKDLSEEELITVATQENVLAQVENLETHPSIAVGLVRGNLKLHAWIYKIETGEVFAYSPEEGQFLPLAEQTVTDTRFIRSNRSVQSI